MSLDNPYHDDTEPGLLATVQDPIDARVHGALKAGARGGLAVLASGFGKGLLIAAVIATVAIIGAAIITSGASLGVAYTGITVAKSVGYGLATAGNWLLGSGGGLALLAGGGVIGSLIAAHSENGRIGKEAAEAEAARYARERERGGNTPQRAQEQDVECPGGHCAQMMQAQKQQEKRGHVR